MPSVHHGAGPSPSAALSLPPGCAELHSVALHRTGVKAPDWLHVAPAGEPFAAAERLVTGRDGRRFVIDDPHRVIGGTELPMQLDWEHRSMLPPYFDGTTRAAGWIDSLVYLDAGDASRPEPGFWAHVARWTEDGRRDVEGGYFRGLSPVVRYETAPAAEGEDEPLPRLRGFVNVALTNRPNLRMVLLHHQEHGAGAPRVPVLTASQRAMAERMGLSEHEYAASLEACAAELAEARPEHGAGAPRAADLTSAQRAIAARLGLSAHEYAAALAEGER